MLAWDPLTAWKLRCYKSPSFRTSNHLWSWTGATDKLKGSLFSCCIKKGLSFMRSQHVWGIGQSIHQLISLCIHLLIAHRLIGSWLTLWTRRNIRESHGYWRMILGSSSFKDILKVANKLLITCLWCLAKSFLHFLLVLGMLHLSLSCHILSSMSIWGLFCNDHHSAYGLVVSECLFTLHSVQLTDMFLWFLIWLICLQYMSNLREWDCGPIVWNWCQVQF
jgi:hypothetical protein